MPFLIIGLALILAMAGCGGGGGGGGGVPLVPAENVTISGKVDDGTANSPIPNAECRFVNLGGGQRTVVNANENGEFRIVVPPNVEGHISCSPQSMRFLKLSTFSSTMGRTAGETITGEKVDPATTIVAQIIESEQSPTPTARKEDLLRSIETAQDRYLTLLVELSTRMYAEMLHHNLDVNFADSGGDGGGNGGGNGDGGGVGGDAGDGGDKSPIANARCDFVIGNSVGGGWSVLYNAALADFREDGVLNRNDLKDIRDIINNEFKGREKEIMAAFEDKFPLGFGQPYSDTTDEKGEYFLPIPPNVPGFVRCMPPGQEKLVIATYEPELLEGEKRLGESVNPATTVFSTNVATKLDKDLDRTKDNYINGIEGLEVIIGLDGGSVTGFTIDDSGVISGQAVENKPAKWVAFSATALFNMLYKNGTNIDYLAALDDLTADGKVDAAFLQSQGLSMDQAEEYQKVVNADVITAGGVLGLGEDLNSALNTARINVLVTDATGGIISGAGLRITGAAEGIICENCPLETTGGTDQYLLLTGVPLDATDITVEASKEGYEPIPATAKVVAFATVDLEIALLDSPPDTTITAGPSGTITTNSASFSYSGTDDVTPTAGLVYATYLQGYDSGWSDFDTATSRAYSNLPNGTYTFQVIARDQAENEDPSPAARTFVVNYTAQPGGALQFSASTYGVSESGGSVTVTVTRTGGSDGAVAVNYATSNGTATSGSDYTSRSGTLNWGSGDSANKTFTVPILNDSVDENNETVNLSLSNPTGGATLGSPSTAVLTITDSYVPQPGALQFSASTYSVNESGGSVTITVRRTGGSDGAVAVNYATSNGTATSGSDYTSRSGTLNWGGGDSANKTFSVPILNDSVDENNETVNLSLSNPTGGATLGSPSTAVLTITDSYVPQPGALQFSASTYSVNESGGSVTITVRRTGGSDGVVAVNYATSNGTATSGSDYSSTRGTLSWGNGDSANKTFSVPILDDSVDENNETVNLALSNPTGGATLGSPSTALLTIIDSYVPQPGALQFSASTYSGNENGGSVTITVRRTGGSDGVVAVNYATSNGTATSGSDYSSTRGTLSWGNGDSANKTFSVPILDDSVDENNETVNLALSNPTGGATLGSPSTAVLTIIDDDEITEPPEIFEASWSLIKLNDENVCGHQSPPGSYFKIDFNYRDINGDVSKAAGATVHVRFTYSDGTTSTFDNTFFSDFSGDGYNGTISTGLCTQFFYTTYIINTITLIDAGGNSSNSLSVTIPKPQNAN